MPAGDFPELGGKRSADQQGKDAMRGGSEKSVESPALRDLMGMPAFAAELTFDRLVNADKEPRNWLTNHRTYDCQRFSPLDEINKHNVNSLHLA